MHDAACTGGGGGTTGWHLWSSRVEGVGLRSSGSARHLLCLPVTPPPLVQETPLRSKRRGEGIAPWDTFPRGCEGTVTWRCFLYRGGGAGVGLGMALCVLANMASPCTSTSLRCGTTRTPASKKSRNERPKRRLRAH